MVFSDEQETKIYYLYSAGLEKSVPLDHCHHSASLVMPNGDPRDGFFYPTLTLMIVSVRYLFGIGLVFLYKNQFRQKVLSLTKRHVALGGM